MKNLLKYLVVAVLGWQVRRLRASNHFKIIGVVGSMGKTSTKNAIAQILSKNYWVKYQDGNYNDIVTVPLVIFGEDLPNLTNPIAWTRLFIRNEKKIRKPYKFDLVVLELGTDGPGQIIKFKKYLKLDHAVITAITPEHMEYFGNLAAVEKEELSVQKFSKQLLINADLCPPSIKAKIKIPYQTYGKNSDDYHISSINRRDWQIIESGMPPKNIVHKTISNAQVYSLSAAAIIAGKLEMTPEEIQESLKNIKAVPGRMNLLDAKNDSTIIDDTYNASPDAMILALEALKHYPGSYKIALLGNMNELGGSAPEMHTMTGQHCKPENINLVVTLGQEANKYLARAAEEQGCKVIRTESPYAAGKIILDAIKPNSVILAKGSQNGVFAEEAIKLLLANSRDNAHLVRQSKGWLAKKQKQFNSAS